MSSVVAIGEKVRKKEAMETLVEEISRSEEESLSPSIRSGLEVNFLFFLSFVLFFDLFLNFLTSLLLNFLLNLLSTLYSIPFIHNFSTLLCLSHFF